jgi:hypothetical protein
MESPIRFHRSVPEPGGGRSNDKTYIGASLDEPVAPAPERETFRELFVRHYDAIRLWCEKERRAGVAVLALDSDGVASAVFLAFPPHAVATAIVGRHTRADLRLEGDPSVSLRHLALLLFPRSNPSHRSRYRLVDLRTASGFFDERGKRLRAIEADGPAFVRVGRYALLLFSRSDSEPPWPEDAEEGWSRIPDRLYLDEVEAEERSKDWERESDRAWDVDALPALKAAPTLVHSVAGPEMAVHELELVAEGDTALGELRIASTRGLATVVLGKRAASAGVLLGRSRRCDAGRVLSDRGISRVHLLVIEIAGALYAVDTASSNGVFLEGAKARAVPLEGSGTFRLGDLAAVSWHPLE